METLYEKIGAENLRLLVEGFYSRVMTNEGISHLFKTDLELIKEKQFMFLSQFLGGPDLYTSTYGPPKMRRRHLPHAIDQNAKDEWLKCMNESIDELSLEKSIKEALKNCFPILAQHMVNR